MNNVTNRYIELTNKCLHGLLAMECIGGNHIISNNSMLGLNNIYILAVILILRFLNYHYQYYLILDTLRKKPNVRPIGSGLVTAEHQQRSRIDSDIFRMELENKITILWGLGMETVLYGMAWGFPDYSTSIIIIALLVNAIQF